MTYKFVTRSEAVTGDWFPLRDAIERALDEAHKDGMELGYDMGQREMRERAAKLAGNYKSHNVYLSGKIRALPIEGE